MVTGFSVDTWQPLKVNYKAMSTYKKGDINCFQGFTSFQAPFFFLPSFITFPRVLKLKFSCYEAEFNASNIPTNK